MARLTATSRPSPSDRRPVRTACSSEPPCGPMPGQRIQTAGSARRTVSRASRSVAPTTRPTSRPQEQASLATCRYSGTSSVRSRPGPLTRSRCRFPGLGVGGAAEHEHPLAFPGQQGLYRFAAQVGAHRGGIRAVVAEQGFGVGLRGRPDVPALGVQDHRRVPRDHLQGPLQGGQTPAGRRPRRRRCSACSSRRRAGSARSSRRFWASMAAAGSRRSSSPRRGSSPTHSRLPLSRQDLSSLAKNPVSCFRHAFPSFRQKKWEPPAPCCARKKGELSALPDPPAYGKDQKKTPASPEWLRSIVHANHKLEGA